MKNDAWNRILHEPHGLSLAVCILFLGFQVSLVVPLTPILISQYDGLDKVQVTIFFVVSVLAGIVVTLATGYLSDGRIQRSQIVAVCGTLGALANIGLAFANTPVVTYLFGVLGTLSFVLFAQYFAIARAGLFGSWSRETQVVGTTVLRTMFSLGFIVGTGSASFLVKWIDIRAIFVLTAGLGVALAVFSAMVLARIQRRITPSADPSKEKTIKPSIPIKALLVPLIVVAVLQGADRTRLVYLPLVTFQLFHDAAVAPLMFGITAATELVTMVLIGYLAGRIGERRAILIGAVVGILYFVVMSLDQTLWILYFANVVYAVFVAALMGVAMAYVQGLLSHSPGLGGSMYVTALNAGSLVGILSPLLVPGYSQTTFVLPAVMCAIGALLLVRKE